MPKSNSDRLPNFLEGKETVLVVSPQPWNGFHVSKHHYAEELESLGNRVYFLDPPDRTQKAGRVVVEPIPGHAKLSLIRYQYWFPGILKFKSRTLFDWCMRWQARKILKQLPAVPSVVWDFDNTYSFNDLRVFGTQFRLFHPVDLISKGRTGAKQAHAAYSVAPAILNDLNIDIPMLVVPHGLGRDHEEYAMQVRQAIETEKPSVRDSRVRVGYVGNMVRPSVDRPSLLTMARNHPDIEFHFYGPIDSEGDKSASEFIKSLQGAANCILHGLTSQSKILEQARSIDAWLVCYDERIDSNAGLNTHKMLEYFATGSVVVSSFIEAYVESNLLVMTPKGKNDTLPSVFADVIRELDQHNSSQNRLLRIKYALQHRYGFHLETIQQHLRKTLVGHPIA